MPRLDILTQPLAQRMYVISSLFILLELTHMIPQTKFFMQRCHADNNAIIGHLKVHILYVSLNSFHFTFTHPLWPFQQLVISGMC